MSHLKSQQLRKSKVRLIRKLRSPLVVSDTLNFLNVSIFLSSGKKAVTELGGELHVLIKEAKNLMAMKPGGTSDSFVKGFVIIC